MSAPLLELESHTLDQTLAIGAAVARLSRVGDVICLIGELGTGKTQFVRGMAGGLGLDPRQVASPTFVIAREYEPGNDRPAKPVLVHIDAYRLTGGEELAAMGWAEAGGDLNEDAITAVEWADRVADVLGEDRLEVRLSHTEHRDGRRIRITPLGGWAARMMQLREAMT